MHKIVCEITGHAYVALFSSVFARQLCLPVPAILFLLAAGAMAAEGKLNLAVVILLSTLACLLADLIWYQAGRLQGDAVLHFAGRFSFGPEASAARIGSLFRRHGNRTLLISKFLIGLDALAPAVRTRSIDLSQGRGALSVLWQRRDDPLGKFVGRSCASKVLPK